MFKAKTPAGLFGMRPLDNLVIPLQGLEKACPIVNTPPIIADMKNVTPSSSQWFSGDCSQDSLVITLLCF